MSKLRIKNEIPKIFMKNILKYILKINQSLMALLRGKQISGITQKNMGITTSSITVNESVTNKEYVITSINDSAQSIHYARLNIDMDANAATVGEKACDLAVIEFPISNVMVKLNGQLINTGAGLEAYFSPDGTTIRNGGNAQKGDYLYWNDSAYNLTADDSISFDYLVQYDRYLLNSNTQITLDPKINTLVVEYDGGAGTTMTVTIDGVDFVVGNVGGAFVWDINGSAYTFTSTNESYTQTVNGAEYTIWFDGFGSLIFSISKGNFAPDIKFHIGVQKYGFYGDTVIVTINNILRDENKYLISGNFISYDDTACENIVRINQDSTIDTTFNCSIVSLTSTPIRTQIKDSNGKYLLGGYFNVCNGISTSNIIRVNQDGSIDTSFIYGTGFNSIINTIIQDTNGKYLIGDEFTTYKGTTVNRIVRLNQDGSIDTSFVYGTGFNDGIYTIIQDTNGKYLIGGAFTTYKGTTANRIVRLNQDGSIDTSFVYGTGFNTTIRIIYQDTNGKYLIGGVFTTYKGIAANRIVRLNQDGSIDTSFIYGTGFNDGIYTIVQDTNSNYLIGGAFTTYKGTASKCLIKLNQNGSINTIFTIGINSYNYVMTVCLGINTNTYITGGYFSTYNQTSVNNIVEINNDGQLIETFKRYLCGFDNSVYNTILDNGKYVFCGAFTQYKNVKTNRIVRVNIDGNIDTSFSVGTGFNSHVFNIIKDSSKYVIGGYFTSYNGINVNYIVRLNQDGSIDNTFDIGSGFDGQVNFILLDSNNKYLVCGYFTTYNDTNVNYIVRLNQDGSIDDTFSIGNGFDNNTVVALQDSNGKYLIGGDFTMYNDVNANYIIRLNQDGSIDDTFYIDAGFDSSVLSMIQESDGNYLIGGSFMSYNGETANYIIRLNQDGSINYTFNVGNGFDNNVRDIKANIDGGYILSGDFLYFNDTSVNYIIKLNPDGSMDNSFNTQGITLNEHIGYSVYGTTILDGGKYLIYGEFDKFNNKPTGKVVRMNKSGVSDIVLN